MAEIFISHARADAQQAARVVEGLESADEAVEAFSAARARSRESLALYAQLLREDGQFATLCAPVVARLQVAEGR